MKEPVLQLELDDTQFDTREYMQVIHQDSVRILSHLKIFVFDVMFTHIYAGSGGGTCEFGSVTAIARIAAHVPWCSTRGTPFRISCQEPIKPLASSTFAFAPLSRSLACP